MPVNFNTQLKPLIHLIFVDLYTRINDAKMKEINTKNIDNASVDKFRYHTILFVSFYV